MPGTSTMALGRYGALLLLGMATLGLCQQPRPEPGLPSLRHSYDCGVRAMQLLVAPRPGQMIRFQVLDEFGNRFEVNNCSSCYHWVRAQPQEPAVFSAEYRGCHVLEKAGRSLLRVLIEAVLPDGRVDVAQDATMICPKPDPTWTPDRPLAPPPTSSPSTPHACTLHPTPGHTSPGSGHAVPGTWSLEHSFTHPTSLPSLGPGPAHPTLPQPQWGSWGIVEVAEPDFVGTHLPQGQCQVASGHIPCMVTSSSKEACQQAGCCYDSTREVPCYYGNKATVQCFKSGYFILILSRETALAHRITLANVHLAYAPSRCPPTRETSTFVVFHTPLTHCGTTVQVIGNQLIYENQLVSDLNVRKGPRGSITRDSTFRLHVRCVFNATDFLPVQASIFPPPPPAPVTQSGPLHLELRIATDKTFSSYYGEEDYPLSRLLREPLHVEVRLLRRADPALVLVLHQCWAAPSANPLQQPQWPILSDGCPFTGDSYRTSMVARDRAELPFPSHHQRFTVATFALLDSSSQRALRGPVYLFCSASACHPSGPRTCSTPCHAGLARRRRSTDHHKSTAKPLDIVSSPGAVAFENSQEPGPTGSSQNSSPKPQLWALLSLLAVALVLGAGVFVGLIQSWAQKLRKASEGQ